MKILVVEDDELMQEALKSVFREHQVSVAPTMGEAQELLKKDCFSVAFLDVNLRKGSTGDGLDLLKKIKERDSYLPCVMISGIQDKEVIMKCLELGAVDYVVKAEGGPEAYRLALFKATMWRKLFSESQATRTMAVNRAVPEGFRHELRGKSAAMQTLRDVLQKLGKLGGPFLVLGETGTGKELAARALWSGQGDAKRPFIAVNCASLPENLVESELFGYERGAFTGALTTKTGLFEAANGGDIFLDEIGELSLDLQAKLLRVLQEKKVRRLGSERERPVDFRVIAATHLDVLSAVRDGEFREDLFYRINVHQVQIPALRERKEDIPELLKGFWEEMGLGRCELEDGAAALIMSFSWGGNVRQLRAFSQYVVPYVNATKPLVMVEHVTKWISMNELRRGGKAGEGGLSGVSPEAEVRAALEQKRPLDIVSKMDSLQRNYVEAALNACDGNRSQAAKILGVSRQRLSNWLNEWRI